MRGTVSASATAPVPSVPSKSATATAAPAPSAAPPLDLPELPSTQLPPLGDTQIQVPSTSDITKAVDETVTGVTAIVGQVTEPLDDTAKDLGNGLLGG